jgi:hypothetical protein
LLHLSHVKNKLGIYKILIQPVLSYVCEVWTVTQSSEERLVIFERKILRIIFGPIYENYFEWKLRYNEELYELLDGPDTVRYIKIKRLQWADHIVQMPRKVQNGKLHGRRSVGKPQLRWEHIRRDSSLLLNTRGRRLAGGRDIWR